MEAIFEASLIPMIRAAVGNVFVYEKSLRVVDIIESELAPLIDKTVHDYPYVYIKSHPKAAEPIPLIELHLTMTSEQKERAREDVEEAAKKISQMIIQYKGKIESG